MANALVQTVILVSEFLKKSAHSFVLVSRALEVVREAARGEGHPDLGVVVDCAADSSDEGTYESVPAW